MPRITDEQAAAIKAKHRRAVKFVHPNEEIGDLVVVPPTRAHYEAFQALAPTEAQQAARNLAIQCTEFPDLELHELERFYDDYPAVVDVVAGIALDLAGLVVGTQTQKL